MSPFSKRALATAALCALWSCTGSAPNTGVGERLGAKGRIVGYFYDADTGAPMADVTLSTYEVSAAVSAKSVDGFAVLDKLTAASVYRVLATKEGYVTRFFNVTVGQVPQDAYDAVGIGNLGANAMSKPSGVINGRVEFLTQSPSPTPIAGASVIADLVNNGSYQLTKTVTTDANGNFTIDGLPSSPTGINISLCVVSAKDAATSQLEFAPTCTSGTAYSGQPSFIVIRPSRVDLGNGDIALFQGVVRDAVSRLPISDVSVFEVGKETAAVTTDANGYYQLKTTSVSRYVQVVFRKSGYSEGLLELNPSRGQTLTNNMTLSPGGASIVGRLLYANLVPANQAEVRIDLRSSNYNVFKTVKTSATGDFTLDQLPALPDGLSVNLTITPWSADPDLFPETSSQNINVTIYPGSPTPLFRQLTSNANLQIVANNTYSGFLGTTEAVQLQMTLPTLPMENGFTLTESASGQTMPFTVAYADTNRRITITPTVAMGQPMWSEARSYNLSVRLRANNGPNGLFITNFTFTPRSSLSTSTITNRIASVITDSPEIDSSTRNFNLRWPPLPDAFGYSVYARTANTPRLPSFVRVATTGASIAPAAGINLGALTFTQTLEPAAGQPFAFGQVITFLVVPVDARGIETDATKGASIDLRDVVVPRFAEGIAQLDDGTGGTRVRFVVRSNEQMDRVNPPMVVAPGGLTFASWVVDEVSGGVEGTLTFTGSATLPASLQVQLRDTSGNLGRALSVPVLGTSLIPTYGFEGAMAGACASTGWTVEANTTCASCPTQALSSQAAVSIALPGTQSAFEGTCSLSFGDSDATFCVGQGITAAFDLTGATFDRRQATLWSRYWNFGTAGSGNYRLELVNPMTMSTSLVSSVNLLGTQRTWQLSTVDLAPYLGTAWRLRLALTNNNVCGSRVGAQVDDLKVFIK